MSQPTAAASSVSHAWTAASESCALDMRHDNHDLPSLNCLYQHLPMALALCVIHHKAAHAPAHDAAVHHDIMHATAWVFTKARLSQDTRYSVTPCVISPSLAHDGRPGMHVGFQRAACQHGLCSS
jgi:hypothetical protein